MLGLALDLHRSFLQAPTDSAPGEVIQLLAAEPTVQSEPSLGWLFWAILAAMVLFWLVEDLLRARRRQRWEAARRAAKVRPSAVLGGSRVAPAGRRPVRSRPERRARREGRARIPERQPGSSPARRAGTR